MTKGITIESEEIRQLIRTNKTMASVYRMEVSVGSTYAQFLETAVSILCWHLQIHEDDRRRMLQSGNFIFPDFASSEVLQDG